MALSTKLGISSVLLLIAFFGMPFWYRHFPVGWLSGVFSLVLGFWAFRKGSKWWLIIPVCVVVVAIFIVVMTFYPVDFGSN
jgi:hypothetical protein